MEKPRDSACASKPDVEGKNILQPAAVLPLGRVTGSRGHFHIEQSRSSKPPRNFPLNSSSQCCAAGIGAPGSPPCFGDRPPSTGACQSRSRPTSLCSALVLRRAHFYPRCLSQCTRMRSNWVRKRVGLSTRTTWPRLPC